jgi:hypothetical protein
MTPSQRISLTAFLQFVLGISPSGFEQAVFEGIIEQGIRDHEFPAQDVQASAACIVGSLFEGLVGPLALDSLSSAERQRQAKATVAFCVRGTGGKID